MSNRLKEKGAKKKVSNPSTTDTLNSFMNFTLQNLRVLDNNDAIFEKRFNYVLSKLADGNTIDEDSIGDSGTFISDAFVELDGKLHKIKYLIEGYQLVPAEIAQAPTYTQEESDKYEADPSTQPEVVIDPNKFRFKKEDMEFDIMAPSLEEAVTELKNRIRASKSIEIVKA